jgi:hypothetical protein
MVPIARLMEFLTDVGYLGVIRLDEGFYQPALVGKREKDNRSVVPSAARPHTLTLSSWVVKNGSVVSILRV